MTLSSQTKRNQNNVSPFVAGNLALRRSDKSLMNRAKVKGEIFCYIYVLSKRFINISFNFVFFAFNSVQTDANHRPGFPFLLVSLRRDYDLVRVP